MAIEIKNYHSQLGLVVKNASLEIVEIILNPKLSRLQFVANVFADSSDYPFEAPAVVGELAYGDVTNLEELIEDSILTKIENVKGKTQQECDEHNKNVTEWIDIWDLSYLRFISSESPDDDLIEAAKIMLEGE